MGLTQSLGVFEHTLRVGGLHAALRFLNSRTPHRFTGVYRYDGDFLRNLHLVDAMSPDVRSGSDVPMADAYCAIVGDTQTSLAFVDAKSDRRFAYKPGSPVVCYCGVLLRDERGEPFGTLCHYDVSPCEAPNHDLPLLEAVAPIVCQMIQRAVSSPRRSASGETTAVPPASPGR